MKRKDKLQITFQHLHQQRSGYKSNESDGGVKGGSAAANACTHLICCQEHFWVDLVPLGSNNLYEERRYLPEQPSSEM